MCSRFSLDITRDDLKSQLGLDIPDFKRGDFYPGQEVLVLTNKIEKKSWGLKPSWFEKPRGPHNARVETASQKPMFRSAYKDKRCVILCTQFYEFHEKKPVAFGTGKLFGVAGLWENETCTMLTQEARAPVKRIHEREPISLDVKDFKKWIEETQIGENPIRQL